MKTIPDESDKETPKPERPHVPDDDPYKVICIE